MILSLADDDAETEHCAIAYLLSREPDGRHMLTTRGVSYSDVFRRGGGAWRIRQRQHSVPWATTAEAVAPPPLPAAFLAVAGVAPG